MSKVVIVSILVVVGVAFVGCANTSANLQRETARYIGGTVTPEQVTVSNVDRGVTDVKWNASAPTGNYNCSADDMVRRVYCTKK